MASEYQAYTVASDGHFIRFEEMICSDDGEAVVKARRLVKDCDIGLERRPLRHSASSQTQIESISDLTTSDYDLPK